MNKGRIVIAAALAASAAAVHAQEKLEVKLSGQVNRAVMFADDGHDSDIFFVDNDNSSTRLRFSGTGNVTPGLKAGLILEVEYQSSPSNLVTFADRDGGSPNFDERHVDLFFEGAYGKLSLGQGDGAANGGLEVDLSGTSVAHYADIAATGGALAFRTGGGAAGPTLGSVLSQQDFESRYDRVRYDTPSFGGARVAVSMGAKDSRDVQEAALWYSADFANAGKLAAALGWSNEDATVPGGIEDEVGRANFRNLFGRRVQSHDPSDRVFRITGLVGRNLTVSRNFWIASVVRKLGRDEQLAGEQRDALEVLRRGRRSHQRLEILQRMRILAGVPRVESAAPQRVRRR